jgi:3-methyladenine DNA glycosylase AlkD
VQFLFELLHASEQKTVTKFMHIQEMGVLLHPIKSLFQKIIHFFSSCINFMSSAFLSLVIGQQLAQILWLTALNSGLHWFEESNNWRTVDWLLSHLTLPASFISQ